MRDVLKGLTLAAVIVGASAAPAAAQQKAWGFGVHGSYLRPGELAEMEPSDDDLKLDNGWSIGGGLESWFGSRRVGLRLDGSWTKEGYVMTFGEHTIDAIDPDEREVMEGIDVNTFFADASLMLRLLRPAVDRRFAPFFTVGTGLVHWRNNIDDDYDFDGDGDIDADNDVGDISFGPADAYLEAGNHSEWALTGGLGADIFFTESVALRLEAKDYWTSDSPWLRLSNMNDQHEGGHNVMWTAGLQFNFGGARVAEPGFVAAPPPPAPTPVAPAPATERVSMCVIGTDGRPQRVDATRYLESGEVFVTRNGREVAFREAYPVSEPQYVRGAPWYIANRPLVLAMGHGDTGGDVDDELDDAIENQAELPADRLEFVRFGTTGPLPMGDVLYIGSIDGTPLYATRSDIGGLLPELEQRLAGTRDLDEVLDDEEFADRFVNEIETFYLAVEPGSADCVFQPVSSTRVIRRTNG
jgi:opacity protein-like surface antigen